MKKMLFTAIIMLVAVMANAKDIKTVVLTTNPTMSCEKCANKIKENLKYCKGIQAIEINVEHQAIAIKYDADKTTPDAFIQSLKKIDYVATEKKPCASEHKSCSGKCEGEKKSCSGKCEGEKKSCGGDCKKSEGGDCKKPKGGCCKKSEGGCCKEKAEKHCDGACKGEHKSCEGSCKSEKKDCCKEQKVDATTGATKQQK